MHFVKSACLYSVNPFSTFFSANNQHNCPILFCMCPTYLPAGLAFRFSFQKQLHLNFWGKWPLAPSIFWTNKLFSQIYSPKLSNEISLYHHSYVWPGDFFWVFSLLGHYVLNVVEASCDRFHFLFTAQSGRDLYWEYNMWIYFQTFVIQHHFWK